MPNGVASGSRVRLYDVTESWTQAPDADCVRVQNAASAVLGVVRVAAVVPVRHPV